ncbi:MAG: hypothetical protein J7K83_01195 [Candidatus Aenigmarchaeota archaeon]|nr:hypothetical protein [Candidatus Aenigmarchaeota archaeon]
MESRELYERRPLKGRSYGFSQYGYVWIEEKLYYHPSCYYTPNQKDAKSRSLSEYFSI